MIALLNVIGDNESGGSGLRPGHSIAVVVLICSFSNGYTLLFLGTALTFSSVPASEISFESIG